MYKPRARFILFYCPNGHRKTAPHLTWILNVFKFFVRIWKKRADFPFDLAQSPTFKLPV